MQQGEEKYDSWHAQYALEDDTQSVWHLFIKENLNINEDIQDKAVLEIGCGRGGLSNYLVNLQPPLSKLVAADYSVSALDIARLRFGNGGEKIVWTRQDIQSISYEDNSFDTVISCETIEHVPDPQKAVKELYRVLKKGGRLYLTCPNYFNVFGLWCVYRYMIGKPYTEGQPYVNYLLLPKLLSWIKGAGFSIERYHTADFVLPLRAHFHFFNNRMPTPIKWLGFRTFFILRK